MKNTVPIQPSSGTEMTPSSTVPIWDWLPVKNTKFAVAMIQDVLNTNRIKIASVDPMNV